MSGSGPGRGRHGRGRGSERGAGGRRGEQGGFPKQQTVGFTVPQGPAKGAGNAEPSRMQVASNVSLGSTASVLLKNGGSAEGIFMGTKRVAGDVSFALGDVKPGRPPGSAPAPPQPFQAETLFPGAEVVQVTVRNVDLSGNSVSPNGSAATVQQGFTTDTDISAAAQKQLVNRELQPWMPDEGDMALEGLSLAPGPRQPGGGKWDQFEANQRQFGVQTSFDEDLYTTKLDRKRAGISEREAARIAREIEGGKTANPHMAEERGQIAYREMDEDEEARYSSVSRGPGPGGTDPSFDTRNDDTFGPSTSSRENGRASAWSSAAGSVAAVTGRVGSASGSSVGRSAPIDMDPRREHNKVRMQLAGSQGKGERSPYGTPKSGKSPLDSPLVGNASQVEALDLNVGVAKYDASVRLDFQKFKQARRQDSFSPTTESELAKVPSASAGSFADSIPSPPNASPPSGQQGAHAEGGVESRPQPQQPPTAPRRRPVLSLPAKGPSTGTQTPLSFGSVSMAESGAGKPPVSQAPSLFVPASAPRSSAPEAAPAGAPPPAGRPPLKLNPFAPEFKLRPTAAPFVPGGATPVLSRAASAASSAAHPPPPNPSRPSEGVEAPLAVPHVPLGGPGVRPGQGMPRFPSQGQGQGRVPGSAGPRAEPRGGGRHSGGRGPREGSGRGPPVSPKARFERQVQSARPYGVGGGGASPFARPPKEGMGHPMQQHGMQQHSQMMGQHMMGGQMMMSPPHMGGPGMPGQQVPAYEMSPGRAPPFVSQAPMGYQTHPSMHPGAPPMYASPPYPPPPHPMMSSPNGQHMFPAPPYPGGPMPVYPQHPGGMPMQLVPQYPGPGR